ncbi:MAG TPA: hypothetical protein VJJ80_00835 [Patescibacteria group bacterium]|nr:hypothetical protein [Patescibacteria group bacterium]
MPATKDIAIMVMIVLAAFAILSALFYAPHNMVATDTELQGRNPYEIIVPNEIIILRPTRAGNLSYFNPIDYLKAISIDNRIKNIVVFQEIWIVLIEPRTDANPTSKLPEMSVPITPNSTLSVPSPAPTSNN